MTKLSTLKNKLVVTTALAASLLGGYGRRAYGACSVTVSPSYSCSGGANITTQTIAADNAVVSTVAGFGVITPSGNAITITGDGIGTDDGALSFTDIFSSTITGKNNGLYMRVNGDNGATLGSITIDINSTITGLSTLGTGIDARNAGGSGALTITANGDTTGGIRGIYASNANKSTGALTITTGVGSTVTGLGVDSISARNSGSGALLLNIGGDVTGYGNGINSRNYGTTLTVITGTGTEVRGASARGIYARDFGSGALTVTANGNVTGYTHGIFARNANGGNLVITTGAGSVITGTSAAGIWARNDGPGLLSIDVDGDVTGHIHGIFTRNYGGSDLAITNQAGGVISGATGIHVTGDALAGGSIDNKGTIKGLDGTAIFLEGLLDPMEITADGGRIIGDVQDANYASGFSTVKVINNFTTEGNFLVSDLTVDSGKIFTVSAGNQIILDTMSKSGGADNAVFNIGVTDDLTFGKLVVTSDNVDLTKVDITVKVTPVDSLSDGAAMLIMDGAAPITGGPGGTLTAVEDDSPFWDFSIVDGTFGDLAGDNSDLYLIAGAALSDDTLASLLPGADIPAQALTMDLTTQGYDIVEGQISALRSGEEMSGMSAGVSANGVSAWLQTFGQTAKQDEHGGVAGYDSDTLGVMAGADSTDLISDGVLGVSFNYGRIHAESKNINTTETDIDSYGFILYGSRKLGSETFMDAQLGYAWNEIGSERHDVGGPGATASADYSSGQYSAKLLLGRDYLADNLPGAVLTPTVSAAYTHLKTEGYTETGAPGALAVGSENFNLLKLGIGANAAWKLQNTEGSLMKPMIRAGYAYNAINDKVETTASFAGDPSGTTFSASGPSPARSTFNAGVGLTYTTAANFDLSANYDYVFKSDYRSHAGVLRATAHF
ncbi:MAG: autotransporter domain-containing protein [Alphaproteobacteria bacterium]|nr:autotransporter domain-containing protein [Alphaproteobacteria bacterium]